MSLSEIGRRLDKLENNLSSSDLVQLWLSRLRSFDSAANYVEWFNDPAKSATAVATFERQAQTVMRRSCAKNRWSPTRFELLHGVVRALRIFVELNNECVQSCQQLWGRFRSITEEAADILAKLRGDDLSLDLKEVWVWLGDDPFAVLRMFAHHLPLDWEMIQILCQVAAEKGSAGHARLWEQLENALERGELEDGESAYFYKIPFSALREVPLVHGEWIDPIFLALARYGERLRAQAGKPSFEETQNLWKEFWNSLGQSVARQIDGRTYLRLSEYVKRDRVDYELATSGVTLASLLSWLDASTARPANNDPNDSAVLQGTLRTNADPPSVSTVTSLVYKKSPELCSRAREWSDRLKSLVGNLDELSCMVGRCQREHFNGQSALFSGVERKIGFLISLTRRLLNLCNAAADLNIFPFSCYIDSADEKLRDIAAARRLRQLVERATDKVRLAERPSWSPARYQTV